MPKSFVVSLRAINSFIHASYDVIREELLENRNTPGANLKSGYAKTTLRNVPEFFPFSLYITGSI